MKILSVYNIPKSPFENLQDGWSITFPEKTFFTKEELVELIPEYDVLLSIFTMPVDKDIIDAGTNLKLISNYGVGFNNVDIRYAREKGIAVTNTPVAVCEPTAELAMALMLSVARRIGECNKRIRKEKEAMWGVMENLGYTLQGKTLGIIGMGRIGKSVARKTEAFNMNVIYHNRSTSCDKYTKVGLKDLLQKSDFISLHCPLTDETRHLISMNEFKLMKPNAILINTARGPVVDESALVIALKDKLIAGAGLDVFEAEPVVNENLYSLDNVILMPHVGSGTKESRVEIGAEALENIENFFNGKPTNVVN